MTPVRTLTAAALTCLATSAAVAADKPYQQFNNYDCGSASSCFVEFPAVPDQSILKVTSISCEVTTLDTTSRLLYATAKVYNKGGTLVGSDALVPGFGGAG